jgi:hypothetical protein
MITLHKKTSPAKLSFFFMRVISLVPSWTETLLLSGVNVVGRTRFCIHPQQMVKNVPVMGGTKDVDWEKVRQAKPDLLLLDQEENPRWMFEQSPVPTVVTHVTSVQSMPDELQKIAVALPSSPRSEIEKLKERWRKLLSMPSRTWNFFEIPGEREKLKGTDPAREFEQIVYVIWKKPWMTVSSETFIGSMLTQFGARAWISPHEQKYPIFEFSDFALTSTYFLFSTEPFPFAQKKAELEKLGLQGGIVDGEGYSWFGLRALEFAEKVMSSSFS